MHRMKAKFGSCGSAVRGRVAVVSVAILLFASGCAGTTQSNPSLADLTAAKAPSAEQLAEHRRLLLAHGERALAAADYGEAHAAFAKIVQDDPTHAKALLGLAESALGAGDAMRALGYAERAGLDEELKPQVLQLRGMALLAAARRVEGEAALREALDHDPSLWRAWNALGRALDGAGRWAEAQDAYERAIAFNPASGAAYNNLGVSRLMQGQYALAESDFRHALAIEPGLRRAHGNLRLALAWQGRYAEASADVARDEVPAVLNNLGYIALQRDELEIAEAYFVRAMQSSPSFYDKADRNLRYLRHLREMKRVAAAG